MGRIVKPMRYQSPWFEIHPMWRPAQFLCLRPQCLGR
jgi:hypothetical protein